MTVIRPNSVSGITSITAQADEINFFRSNGTLAGLQLNGVNFNTTTGVSTFNNLDVGGVLTYQDVTNVDSVGIITARSTIDAQGDVSIADKIIHTGDTNTAIRFPSADTITAETGGTERLRITSDGLVGIGTIPASGTTLDIDASGGGVLVLRRNSVNTNNKISLSHDGTNGTLESTNAVLFRAGGSERLRITSGGHLNAGGTVLSISDLNWSHDTYQRPHIFSGITGGNPSDGAITLASPETNPSNTRIGAVVFGCKTSSTSGVSNSGVKASIEGWTNTNVSDAWKTGSYIRFQTRPDNGNLSEKLRITSDGNITFGHTSTSLAVTSAAIKYISGGRDYWNGTKGDYRALRFRVYDNGGNIDDQYGMGISSSELEIQSQQDIGFYAGTSGSSTGRRELRILLDSSENSLNFESNTKLFLKGTVNDPTRHAKINIGRDSAGETRAIDVWGSWSTGENKSITFTHASNASDIVGQINCIHNSPGSSLRWGKLYHGGNSTAYTMTLDSTGTTSADLNLKGAYRSTRHPAFSAGSSGNNNNLGSTTKLNYTISGTGAANNDGYDTTNNRFVAPVDGFYHFYTRHWFTTGQTGTAWLYFYRNGAEVKECRLNITSTTSEYNTMQLSTTLYLSASNYIEVYAAGSGSDQFHPSGGTRYTEFSGFLVC